MMNLPCPVPQLDMRPIFRPPDFIKDAQIPAPTARRIVSALRENGMLREIRASSGRRPATLVFSQLVNIAEGKEAF